MLTLSNVKAAQAENYYERDDYYTQGDTNGDKEIKSDSQWQGNGAANLNLSGPVDKAKFQQLLHGQTPDGKPLHSRKINPDTHRAATDYTFSAPKSVSIAALIQKDKRVIAAHDHAVKTALEVLENRYAQTRIRRGPGIRERVTTGNIIAATFRHETSREQDPQLHTHCVVINATQLENGKWQSMANEEVLRNQKLLGEIYQNELAHQLRQVGYEIAPKENGVFECKGYEEPLLNLFSTRTQQIENYIEKWEATLKEKGGKPLHAKQKEQATLATRLRKQTVPRMVLLSGWENAITRSDIHLPKPPELTAIKIENRAATSAISGVNHASERESVFKREKAERFALENHLGEQSFSELQNAMSGAGLIAAKDRHTTQAAIERERETISIMESGQGKENAISTPTDVLQLTADEQTLTMGQYKAILDTATSRDQFIAWQGVAGAGKTYSLRLLSHLASEKGYRVSGYAPSAQAANTLSEEAGIEGNTVASLLHRKSSQSSAQPSHPQQLPKQPLWIVDEAGLLSAKDAHALLKKAQSQNARVILVGDIRQLSAVEAGNPFKSLQKAGIQTCYLEESRRQKTAALKATVVCLAAGEQAEGLQQLEQAELVHEIKDPNFLRQHLVLDYLSASEESREQTLILCGTNQERLELTADLRTALQQERRLGPDTFTLQSLRALDRTKAQLGYVAAYSEGEVVVFNRDYRRAGIHKGVQYRVTGRDLEHNRLTLATPQGKPITFDPSGCIEKTTYAVQEIVIAPGEQLRWTRNDHKKGLRNGQLVTVTAIAPDGTATLREVSSNEAKAKETTLALTGQQYLDYALVSTTYSAQGKTAERVLAISDATLSKEGLYVAVSRAKRNLSLYTTSRAELHKRAERSSAKENPSDYLSLYELVKPDAENKKAPGTARDLRRERQSERLGDYIGAISTVSCTATNRADSAAEYARRAAERTPASISRAGRVNGAQAEQLHADVERQLDAAAERRRQRVAQAKKHGNRQKAYRAVAEYVGGGVDVDIQDQDQKVAKQVLIELTRGRSRYSLTREDKQKAEAIVRASPEAERLAQATGEAAAQAYVIDRLTQANRQIVARVHQQERTRQQERGGGLER
ncbi:MAG: MobF family relaxase [Cyanobacteria bacterium J06631_12]